MIRNKNILFVQEKLTIILKKQQLIKLFRILGPKFLTLIKLLVVLPFIA
jgi:hypothetical protein